VKQVKTGVKLAFWGTKIVQGWPVLDRYIIEKPTQPYSLWQGSAIICRCAAMYQKGVLFARLGWVRED